MANLTQDQVDDSKKKKRMPMSKNEDVEFSFERADSEDLEALQRAREADERQQRSPH